MSKQNASLGISLTIAAYFVLSLFTALNKLVQEMGVSTLQVLLFDGSVGALCIVMAAGMRRDLSALKIKSPLQVLLMVLNVSAAFLFFQAFPHLPLFNAYLIAFCGPLMIVTLSALSLKEKITVRQALTILCGFSGVVVALGPQEFIFNAAVVKMIAGTILFSIAQVLVRRMSADKSTLSFLFHFYAGMFLAAALLFQGSLVMPNTTKGWAMLLMLGVLDAASLAMIYLGLKYAKASTVAPFQYSAMLWMVLLDMALWDKIPPPHTWIGAAIIVSAGVYLIRQMRKV